jgi:putative ABC transport system permease protein
MAWRDLARRRLRTGLTVAGIVVGVALILFLLSLVAGINVQVRASVRGLGGADITVNNATVTGERQTFIFGSTATLNESLVGNIASLPDVYAESPESLEVVYTNGALAPIWGIDPSTYDKTSGALNIISGREIGTSDVNVADVGQGLAQFLNLSLGDNVTIQARSPHQSNSHSLTVVGIYETGQTLIDRGLYVERSTVTNLTNSNGTVTSILVKVNDPNNVGFVSSEISGLFPGTRVVTASTLVSSASQLLNTLTLFFTAIGLVALVAGSFGVINTMLISVFERTREIGTMKAIGAKQSTILRLFVYEAVIIGVLGGIVGLIIGGGASVLLSLPGRLLSVGRLGGLSPVLTGDNLALSFLLGLGTGTLAGLYPAWRASRMRTVEALRNV